MRTVSITNICLTSMHCGTFFSKPKKKKKGAVEGIQIRSSLGFETENYSQCWSTGYFTDLPKTFDRTNCGNAFAKHSQKYPIS